MLRKNCGDQILEYSSLVAGASELVSQRPEPANQYVYSQQPHSQSTLLNFDQAHTDRAFSTVIDTRETLWFPSIVMINVIVDLLNSDPSYVNDWLWGLMSNFTTKFWSGGNLNDKFMASLRLSRCEQYERLFELWSIETDHGLDPFLNSYEAWFGFTSVSILSGAGGLAVTSWWTCFCLAALGMILLLCAIFCEGGGDASCVLNHSWLRASAAVILFCGTLHHKLTTWLKVLTKWIQAFHRLWLLSVEVAVSW